jgi:hypothetical protein
MNTRSADLVLTEDGVFEFADHPSDLGYRVTFVTEATATNPIAHRDAPQGQTAGQLLADPRTLPVSAIIERTEYALAGRFATIATIAEVTGQVTRPRPSPAGTPAEPVG